MQKMAYATDDYKKFFGSCGRALEIDYRIIDY
jgi:hypothetical protein